MNSQPDLRICIVNPKCDWVHRCGKRDSIYTREAAVVLDVPAQSETEARTADVVRLNLPCNSQVLRSGDWDRLCVRGTTASL
ncbi:hypothetical protein HDF11_002987 [Tunturiibacter psychrotolerans]